MPGALGNTYLPVIKPPSTESSGKHLADEQPFLVQRPLATSDCATVSWQITDLNEGMGPAKVAWAISLSDRK